SSRFDFLFFSSRRRHTRFSRDWSSDVCSSDLDPYAVYARRILGLFPLEPLLRDPGAAERGTLFHAILHRFSTGGPDRDWTEAAADRKSGVEGKGVEVGALRFTASAGRGVAG